MMAIAATVGHEQAHAIVTAASRQGARAERRQLLDVAGRVRRRRHRSSTRHCSNVSATRALPRLVGDAGHGGERPRRHARRRPRRETPTLKGATMAEVPLRGRLAGRRALVTGAGGGLCRSVVRAFAAEGADVALLGRGRGALERAAAPVEEAGRRAVVLVCDVADAAAAAAAVDDAADALGGLDVVVNGAAIDTGWAPAGEMSLAVWEGTITINLNGTYYVCRAALPHLIGAGGGAIVNITSVAGKGVGPRCRLQRLEGGRGDPHADDRRRVRHAGNPRQLRRAGRDRRRPHRYGDR